jgi:hypothetical protein
VGGGGPRPEEAQAAVAIGGTTGRRRQHWRWCTSRGGVQAASRVVIGGWSSVGRDGARQPQAVEGGRSSAGRGGGQRAPGGAGCRRAAACGGGLGLTGRRRGRVGRLDAGVGKISYLRWPNKFRRPSRKKPAESKVFGRPNRKSHQKCLYFRRPRETAKNICIFSGHTANRRK